MMIVRVLESSPPDEASGAEVGEVVGEGLFVDEEGTDDVDGMEEEPGLDVEATLEEVRVEEVIPVVAAAPRAEAMPPT